MSEKNIGSNFDDFLKEEGIFEEVTTDAIKILHKRFIGNDSERLAELQKERDKIKKLQNKR